MALRPLSVALLLALGSSSFAVLDLVSSTTYQVQTIPQSSYTTAKVRPDGKILAIGSVGADAVIALYSSNGILQAFRRYDSVSRSASDTFIAIEVDASNNAFVVCRTDGSVHDLVKYGPNLEQGWRLEHTNPAPATYGGPASTISMAVLGAGPYLLDTSQGGFRISCFASSTGALLWQNTFLANTETRATALKALNINALIAGGQSGTKATLIRVHGSGVLQGMQQSVPNRIFDSIALISEGVVAVGNTQGFGIRAFAPTDLSSLATSSGSLRSVVGINGSRMFSVTDEPNGSIIERFSVPSLSTTLSFSTPYILNLSISGDGSHVYGFSGGDSPIERINTLFGVRETVGAPFAAQSISTGSGNTALLSGQTSGSSAALASIGGVLNWDTSSAHPGFDVRKPLHAQVASDNSIVVAMDDGTATSIGKYSMSGTALWVRPLATPSSSVRGLEVVGTTVFALVYDGGVSRLNRLALGNGGNLSSVVLAGSGRAMTLTSVGEVLVAGQATVSGDERGALWRFSSAGTLVRLRLDPLSSTYNQVRSLADGRAVVFGSDDRLRTIASNGTLVTGPTLLSTSLRGTANFEIDSADHIWLGAATGSIVIFQRYSPTLLRLSERTFQGSDFRLGTTTTHVVGLLKSSSGSWRMIWFYPSSLTSPFGADLPSTVDSPIALVREPAGKLLLATRESVAGVSQVRLTRFSAMGVEEATRLSPGSPYLLRTRGSTTWALGTIPVSNRGHEMLLNRYAN